MENYPFYLKFILTIKSSFGLLSRIRSVINAPDSEICAKNKILSIKMTLCAYRDELEAIEHILLEQEFNHMEAEVLMSQQQMSALGIRFTLNLN